jgi:Fe-S cluster biogenesis protein NfuA
MHGEPTQTSPFTREQVEAVLDRVRPGIAAHGGGIDLVCIAGCDVKVTLRGACVGCPSSTMTLRYAVEQQLRQELEGFGELIAEAPSAPERQSASWWRKFL